METLPTALDPEARKPDDLDRARSARSVTPGGAFLLRDLAGGVLGSTIVLAGRTGSATTTKPGA